MSTFSQFFPPKSTFSVSDIPDLTGKVIIVTGGYTGVGKETVKVCYSFRRHFVHHPIEFERSSDSTLPLALALTIRTDFVRVVLIFTRI